MNSITDLFDLEDADITVTAIQIQGQTKTLFLESAPLESAPVTHFCPSCGYKCTLAVLNKEKSTIPFFRIITNLFLS